MMESVRFAKSVLKYWTMGGSQGAFFGHGP